MGERDHSQRASHKVSTKQNIRASLTISYDSIELAGVNMRLEEGAIRELHWHKEVLNHLPIFTLPVLKI